jgi:hypothetical protein
MKLGWQPRKWLEKKAKRGMRGYRRATKVVVGIIPAPRSEPAEIHRSFGETGDVRVDETVFAEIVTFLREHKVQSVAMTEKILGCPTRRESTNRTVRLVQIAHIGREGTVGLARAGTNRRRRLVGRL